MKKSTTKTNTTAELSCEICKQTGFKSRFQLQAHLYTHNAVPARFHCSDCSKSYFRSDEYKRHMEGHENKRKLHYCDHCGRGFVDKRSLIKHLVLHDDMPSDAFTKLSHRCLYCKISYSEARSLFYHIQKSHLNTERDFQKIKTNECWIESVQNTKECAKITKINNNVISIKKCEYVSKKRNIQTKDVFYQHYKASLFAQRTNQYKKVVCDYCNKEMLKKSIGNHIREAHLKLKRFVCDVCKKGFSRHYMLSDHRCGATRRQKKKVNKK